MNDVENNHNSDPEILLPRNLLVEWTDCYHDSNGILHYQVDVSEN